MPRPLSLLYSLPRVSEKGTLQLSIDADSVRRLLLEFPKAARPLDDPSEFASYAHHVEREMGGAINLVKVLQVGMPTAGRGCSAHHGEAGTDNLNVSLVKLKWPAGV